LCPPPRVASSQVTPYDRTVIEDVDDTLTNFLGARLGRGVTVTIDPPTTQWAGGKPNRLGCFLHHIREDTSWLNADWRNERDAQGRMEGRRPPAHHYRMHYLVSAWCESTAAEHRLLGQVMRVGSLYPIIPDEYVAGTLAGGEDPVRLWLVTPEPSSGVDLVDVWESLGVGARLTLELVVGAVLVPELDTDLATATESMTLDMGKMDTTSAAGSADDVVKDRQWTTFRLRERTSTPGGTSSEVEVNRPPTDGAS
jgi:Pvc16 N-terminal domain